MQREQAMGDTCRTKDEVFAALSLNQDRLILPRESFAAGVASYGFGPELPEACGTGRLCVDIPSPGIVFGEIETFGATEDIDCRLELSEPMYGIEVHLGYEAQRVYLEGVDEPLILRRGTTHLLSSQRIATTVIRKGAGCHELIVFLHPDTVLSLLEGDGMPCSEDVARFLEEGRRSPVIDCAFWTTGIRSVVEQIRACPYSGTLRNIYLESKVLELFVLRLEAIFGSVSVQEASRGITDRDRKMLEEARRILESSIKDPPTIGELARMVGTNRTKLKNGFRSLFGSCVFEHLRHCRMEQALLLLRDFDTNVNEVAGAVGYSSVSAFSAAFHKSHGFSPREARANRPSDSPAGT
jgi:AraC-like DNA-binding protein